VLSPHIDLTLKLVACLLCLHVLQYSNTRFLRRLPGLKKAREERAGKEVPATPLFGDGAGYGLALIDQHHLGSPCISL
jgi:hypothetical protein